MKQRIKRIKVSDTIVIFGLGPTGLAAAIETAQQMGDNKRIVVISNRVVYDRNPIFRINEATYNYLSKLLGNDVLALHTHAGHFHRVTSSHDIYTNETYYEIQIKRIEAILYQKLDEYKANIEFIYINKNETFKINAETSDIQLHDGTLIPFKYLVAADGSNHRIAEQLMKQGIALSYHTTQQRQLHSFHSIGCFKMSDEREMRKFRRMLYSRHHPNEKTSHLLIELKKMGWKHFSFPENRIFIVENTLYVGAEAPKNGLLCNADIDKWLRYIMKNTFSDADVDMLTSSGITDNRLNCGAFTITLEEANRVVVPLPSLRQDLDQQNTSYFIQLGDALRSPHYLTGSGAVIGLQEANAWGNYMASSQTPKDLSIFEKNVELILAINREKVDAYLTKRRQREETAKSQLKSNRSVSSVSFFRKISPQQVTMPALETRGKKRQFGM